MVFVDHHVHFMATAAACLSVDVSAARSVDEVVAAISHAPAPGRTGWIRAWGYDESLLGDGRHPTRADLDRARPGAPVVLHHRTGHAAVLNSRALQEIGGDEPDGLMVDRHALLARVPRLDPGELRRAARRVSAEWARRGIGAFVDATATNGPAQLEALARWCHDGVITQDVTAMVSPEAVHQVPRYGSRLGAIRVGHAKIVPGPGPGPGHDAGPGPGAALAERVAGAHRCGFPVAVHVTEIDVLDETLHALEASPPPPGTADRIEHCALSLPEQVARIAEVGATAVVNPSFLLHRRVKYEKALQPVEREWLIRIRSLLDAGVKVRAGSDSPVTPARPQEMLAAAMSHPFSPEESVDEAAAAGLLAP